MSALREPGFWAVTLAVAILVTLVMVAVVVVIRRRRKANTVGQVKLPVAPKPPKEATQPTSSTSTAAASATSGPLIHVSLSLVGDPEPAKTLLGLYRRASHKGRLRWGVWTEAPDLEDRLAKLDPTSSKALSTKTKIHTARPEAFPGEGPVRHTIESQLLPSSTSDTDLFVQLGPCTRALAGWDVMLTKSLGAAKGDKVLLTAPVLKPISKKRPPPAQPTFTLCQGFDGGLGGNMPIITGRHFVGHPKTPVPQGFFTGSFVCGPRAWVEEVGHPDLWAALRQLDFPMTARCWTAGWDLKTPDHMPFYRADRGPRVTPPYENTPELATALRRVASAVGMDGGPGRFGGQDGLSDTRPLRDLFMKLGVFPAAHKVNKRGLLGLHAPERFYDEEVALKYGTEAKLVAEHDRVVASHAAILASPEPSPTAGGIVIGGARGGGGQTSPDGSHSIRATTSSTAAPLPAPLIPAPQQKPLAIPPQLPHGSQAAQAPPVGAEGAQPIV